MKFVRLPKDIVPEKYVITLRPDLSRFIFEGSEIIHLDLRKPVRKISLHSKGLEVYGVEIMKGASVIPAVGIKLDEKFETATFDFKKTLPRGKYQLSVSFRGKLGDDLHGFYRSSYRFGKKTKYMATTQFEATDARRAFPCFDEPALKAVFQVTFVIPKELTAISNTMPIAINSVSSGMKAVEFSPSPKMSTYLLAFIVGEFEHIEKKTPEGVLVRVFTTRDKKHQAKFALQCATKTISFFSRYFDIPYPLPVLDMIAIPDFASGAMENWGAVTYRESALLFDEEHSSSENKQWVALVIAHELAHQWFGNLVTMQWWTHLWLNEGFASYIEYVAVDHIFPEWKIWDHFLSADLGRALKLDGLKHTHPIEVEVGHPGEINEIFDAVSYSKGASIIRMLADYLGEDTFRKGLSHYLKKHSYANAETGHLWRAFQKVSGKPVVRMMNGWTRNEGYPLVTVARGRKGMNIRQSRFFSNPASKGGKDPLWVVPVRFATRGDRERRLLLDKREEKIPAPSGDDWLKLNVGETGFFRAGYPRDIWRKLGASVANQEFSTADRLGLVRDVAALAEAGHLSAVDTLDFARHYRLETEYVVWLEIAAAVKQAYLLISGEPFAPAYRKFARGIFAEAAGRMGWEGAPGEKHSEKLLRSMVLHQFGYYGDLATISRARKMFAGVRRGSNRVSPDLRDVVYDLVAQYGGQKEHAKLTHLYKSQDLQEERSRIGGALGRFRNKTLLKKTLAFSLSRHVRAQDTPSIIGSVWLNPFGRDLAWDFVKKNWKILVKRYGDGHALSRLVSLAGSFRSDVKAREVELFFRKHPVPMSAERTLRQALEQIRGNATWVRRDKKKLEKWLGI